MGALLSETGYADESAVLQEMHGLGACTLAIANRISPEVRRFADLAIELNLPVPEFARLIVNVVWGQLLGSHLGLRKGLNPGSPRNLSRFVKIAGKVEMNKRFDVTIAGEINLDLILYGLPEVMPVDRELLANDFRLTLGSSSAIAAHNLAALGMSVGFITRVGDDPLGSIALDRLAERSVDLSRIKRVSGRTSTGVTILLTHDSKRHILTYPGTMYEMAASDLDMTYLASGQHFHLSSLFLHRALQSDLPRICRGLKSEGLTISLDTNDDPEDRWGGALDELLGIVDIFLPNEDEACRITGKTDAEGAI